MLQTFFHSILLLYSTQLPTFYLIFLLRDTHSIQGYSGISQTILLLMKQVPKTMLIKWVMMIHSVQSYFSINLNGCHWYVNPVTYMNPPLFCSPFHPYLFPIIGFIQYFRLNTRLCHSFYQISRYIIDLRVNNQNHILKPFLSRALSKKKKTLL